MYDTMAQASAATGIPVGVFRLAKRRGCKAFRYTRVEVVEFLTWWFAQDQEQAGADWPKELAKEKTLRERIKRAEDEKRLIDKGVVETAIAAGMATLFSEMERVFCDHLPARAKGLTEIGIRDLAVAEIERMKLTLNEKWEASLGGGDE